MAPPDFGRSVNPNSTRGSDYAPHITTCPSTALISDYCGSLITRLCQCHSYWWQLLSVQLFLLVHVHKWACKEPLGTLVIRKSCFYNLEGYSSHYQGTLTIWCHEKHGEYTLVMKIASFRILKFVISYLSLQFLNLSIPSSLVGQIFSDFQNLEWVNSVVNISIIRITTFIKKPRTVQPFIIKCIEIVSI